MLYASLVRTLIWWQVVVVDIFVSGVSDTNAASIAIIGTITTYVKIKVLNKIPSRIPT